MGFAIKKKKGYPISLGADFHHYSLLLIAKGQGVTREMGPGQSVSVRRATVSAAVMGRLTC